MSDLVERLRRTQESGLGGAPTRHELEAAEEIDRLREFEEYTVCHWCHSRWPNAEVPPDHRCAENPMVAEIERQRVRIDHLEDAHSLFITEEYEPLKKAWEAERDHADDLVKAGTRLRHCAQTVSIFGLAENWRSLQSAVLTWDAALREYVEAAKR